MVKQVSYESFTVSFTVSSKTCNYLSHQQYYMVRKPSRNNWSPLCDLPIHMMTVKRALYLQTL